MCVCFLCVLQVQESTEASKRSFLESKGLSKEQIDEAFKQAGLAKTAGGSASAPLAGNATAPAPAVVAATAQQQSSPAQQPFRWTQVSLIRRTEGTRRASRL